MRMIVKDDHESQRAPQPTFLPACTSSWTVTLFPAVTNTWTPSLPLEGSPTLLSVIRTP